MVIAPRRELYALRKSQQHEVTVVSYVRTAAHTRSRQIPRDRHKTA